MAEPGDRALGRPAGEGGPPSTSSGPGRVLVGLYGLFALAAGARATVQIATKFDEAPVAYLLSALAAVIYLVATIGLVRGGRGGRRIALVAISIELAGVLIVGTLSLTDRAAFPDETVWSTFGKGYGFIPLALPILGLLWLRESKDPPAPHHSQARGGPLQEGRQKSPPKSPPPKSPPPKSPP